MGFWTYILRLGGGRRYVGYSSRPGARIRSHYEGRGSSYTKRQAEGRHQRRPSQDPIRREAQRAQGLLRHQEGIRQLARPWRRTDTRLVIRQDFPKTNDRTPSFPPARTWDSSNLLAELCGCGF